MRLTLRTLLAYIDDTLPPQQTRQIGQKVAEHEAAQELIARIKQVTRRRRLTTPDMAGTNDTNVDPNIVAEYLDNELAPEKIEELEKLCLESDVNLAEVAACHQILTVILGEPAKVPPTSYQRMYGLVKGREAVPTRRPPAAAAVLEPIPGEAHDETSDALLLGMPAYQSSSPWMRRLIPVAAAVLLVACLAGIIYVASQGERRRPDLVQGSRAAPKDPKAEPPAVKIDHEKTPTKPMDEPPPPEPVQLAMDPTHLWAGWVAYEGKDAPGGWPWGSAPMWSSWVATLPGSPIVMFAAYTPNPDAGGRAAEPPPAASVKVAPPPSAAQVIVGEFVVNRDKDAAPALLVRRVAADDWRLVRPDAKVRTGEVLMALPGYRDEIQLDSKLRLSLVGGLPSVQENIFYESVLTLHDNPDVTLDLTLDHGRTVIVNRPAGDPATVRLRFLDQVWDVKLLQPESRIGFEMHGRVPRGSGEWSPHVKVGLLVTGGSIELTRGGKTEKIAAGKVFVWDQPSPNRTPGLLVDLKEPPAWLKDKSTYPNDVRTALAQVQDRMSRKPQIGEEKTPWIAIACEESLQENAMWQRWIGLFGLGALDQLKVVIRGLDESERHDLRFAALDTLRNWAGKKPSQDQQLRELLLQREYSPEDADLVLQLLRGYDQFSAPTVRQLLSNLNNPRLIIRELALANLNLIAPPDKLSDFRNLPLSPPEMRQKAIETLETRLLPKP